MDKLLKKFKWHTACCFIDDIVVYSPTFEQHLKDIDEILETLKNAGLTIQPYKCFVSYHSLKILGQLVDRFGLTSTEEHAEAILRQTYPQTLDKLDYFLSATRWNRHLLPYYSQITGPLQSLKTHLFKNTPKSSSARKKFTQHTRVTEQ